MKTASKNQKPLPLERPAAVALSDEQVAEKSKRLCGLRAAVRGLQRDIKDATRTKKAEIKSIEATMLELETQIVEGMEMRAQGTLKYAEAEAAKKDLAKIAAVAGETGAEAPTPAPSEPHAFHKPLGKRDECVLCGGTQADPVHGNGKAAALAAADAPHLYMPTQGEPGDACGVCDTAGRKRAPGHPIHSEQPIPSGKGKGAYEFDTSETAPNVIRTHPAVDLPDRKRAKVMNRKARRAEKGGRL